MKKILSLIAVATLLSACASTGEINASRGQNTSRLTDAELKQYSKQRGNEVHEAQTMAAKARGYADAAKEGASVVKEAVNIFRMITGR